MEENKEKVLMILRKTRKAFFVEYACGVFLLMVLGVLAIKGIDLKPIFTKAIFGLAIFSMVSAEYERVTNSYKITDEKIVHTKGLIKQHKKNIYFAPLGFLPNINSHQGHLQRFLGFGTISISGIPSGGGGQSSFEIKDISNPQKILSILEEWIDYYRNKHHGINAPKPR